MKIAQETGNVERVGIGEEGQFKIKASAKAFEILSSGLYSDKVRAIIRELSCNAYDSHIEAGNEDPFLLHLPNDLEPYFSLRDFGIGLCHEDVMNIFPTYFESTKTSSNDFVGCLGLGSKSPFSYTDSFMVTSIFDGKVRIYNSFLDEHRIPSIVLMSENDTDERNGVEIQFPVEQNDFHEFTSKTPKVLEYFKLKPEIVGAEVKHNEINYFITRDNWGVRGKGGAARDYQQARAVMGNIAYPIGDFNYEGLSQVARAVLRLDIDIFFNIGDLDIAASREKLSYDKQTNENIKNRLEQLAGEIIEEIGTKIQDCECKWDARKLIYSMRAGDYSVFQTLIDSSDVKFTWKGIELFDSSCKLSSQYVKVDLAMVPVQITRFNKSNYRRARGRFEGVNSIPVNNVHIFIEDKSNCKVLRVEKYIAEQCGGSSNVEIIFVRDVGFPSYAADDGTVVPEDHSQDGFAMLREHLGMMPDTVFPLVSEMPFDKDTSVSTVNPLSKCTLLEYDPMGCCTRRGSYSSYWSETTIDKTKGGIYVPIDRYKVDDRSPADALNPYFDMLKLLGSKDVTVYGVKSRKVGEFERSKQWTTLKEHTVRKVTNYLKRHNLAAEYGIQNEMSIIESDSRYGTINKTMFKMIGIMSKDMFTNSPDVYAFIERLESIKKTSKLCTAISNFSNRVYGISVLEYDTEAVRATLKEELSVAGVVIKENYPLLLKIDSFNPPKEAMAHYIKLVSDSLK